VARCWKEHGFAGTSQNKYKAHILHIDRYCETVRNAQVIEKIVPVEQLFI